MRVVVAIKDFLAFEGTAGEYAVQTRLGILGGSLVAAFSGCALLRAALRRG